MDTDQCCVVVSYPRSGTHLTLDFLRKNFTCFNYRPPFLASSETLYYGLDTREIHEEGQPSFTPSLGGKPRANEAYKAAGKRSNFLVKTHDLPFARGLEEKLKRVADGRKIVFIYPFRRFSKTMASYHAHRNCQLPLREFLNSRDDFMGVEASVQQSACQHGTWALEHADALNVGSLLATPSDAVRQLSAKYGWEPVATTQANPLPAKRLAAGRLGEIVERFRGRQSSEVFIPKPSTAIDASFIDEIDDFSELYNGLENSSVI